MAADHADGIPRRNGLRVDAAKQRDWQRRGAIRYAGKQRERRNQARLTTKAPSPAKDWTDKVRRQAKERSQGFCEVGGSCWATDLHHRKLRGHGDHRVQNALHVCRYHHDYIHGQNGGSIAESKRAGWIVASNADPAAVTVLIASGDRVRLDDRGRYQDAA